MLKITPRRYLRLLKITPRRYLRLNFFKEKVNGLKSPANEEVYRYKEKGTTKELVVMKPVAA